MLWPRFLIAGVFILAIGIVITYMASKKYPKKYYDFQIFGVIIIIVGLITTVLITSIIRNDELLNQRKNQYRKLFNLIYFEPDYGDYHLVIIDQEGKAHKIVWKVELDEMTESNKIIKIDNDYYRKIPENKYAK